MKNISPWACFCNFTRRYFMCLILSQNHLHNFNLRHRIWRKINNLKKEKLLFETNMKLCNMRFEKMKNWEGVASRRNVMTKDYYWKCLVEEPFLAKFVGLAPCQSKGEIFLICHVSTWSMCYVTLWVGSLHPKSPAC